jgi:hypothetical protein
MEQICWFGIGFLAVALIGHGIWVVVARILGYRVETRRPAPQFCRHCGRPQLAGDQRCRGCGKVLNESGSKPTSEDDLTRTADQLARLASLGLIDAGRSRGNGAGTRPQSGDAAGPADGYRDADTGNTGGRSAGESANRRRASTDRTAAVCHATAEQSGATSNRLRCCGAA